MGSNILSLISFVSGTVAELHGVKKKKSKMEDVTVLMKTLIAHGNNRGPHTDTFKHTYTNKTKIFIELRHTCMCIHIATETCMNTHTMTHMCVTHSRFGLSPLR